MRTKTITSNNTINALRFTGGNTEEVIASAKSNKSNKTESQLVIRTSEDLKASRASVYEYLIP